jgi:diguanylate cyclase (GGDEF)-like protein
VSTVGRDEERFSRLPEPNILKDQADRADGSAVMAGKETSPNGDRTRAPTQPPAFLAPAQVEPPAQAERDIERLGRALQARAEDVLSLTVKRTIGSGQEVDALIQDSFERICQISTIAVARWMAGDGLEVTRPAARETGYIFGQLAAHRAASLQEVTRRCLLWRNSVGDVLRDCAEQLDATSDALHAALAMLQLSLDVTLVRICERFETERLRTDQELARRQEELAFMATHDSLTGLPNRTLMLDRVEQMLVRAHRHQSPIAALFVDLDNFKRINDTLGHEAGDDLLRAVTARLEGVVREADALGRIGGDEFVIVAEEVSPATGPELIAERLLEALREPFELAASPTTRPTVTASIGIAMGDGGSPGEFLRDADIAMHRAKWDGKNRYVVFESDMQDAVQSRMELEIDLRQALANGEFVLNYQPTFDLTDMSPTGMEALIRWKHARRGTVQPNDFIPLLEETGLIIDVGAWVLNEACHQGAVWRAAGHKIGVAVNVSGRQLDDDGLVVVVEHALADTGLEASALTLEVTETTLMRNPEAVARRLGVIKAVGVRIAIDDFGTGYSSLAHLQQFPVDALKIDRSFISRLTDNPEGETLIHTLVQLGKALSIETLAEGIEHQQELSVLKSEQCDSGQGFLFARPLDVDATEAFLRSWADNGAPAFAAAP